MLRHVILFGLLVATLLSGCSQSLYMQGKRHLAAGRHDAAIDAFYKEIAANPANADAWRELGVTYYERDELAKADEALKQANSIQPDGRTHAYLGMLYEKQGNLDRAINAYAASLSLRPDGKAASATRAHLLRLVDQQFKVQAEEAIRNEATIDVDTIPENTVAVADFDGSRLPPELAPIALGMAEFTSTDLAKVTSLTVVERQKLGVLLEELELGRSGLVDPSTAPRVGRLIGSHRVITGSVLGMGSDGLRLDGIVVSVADSSTVSADGVEGKLDQFFQLEKEFVFGLLEDMGIELTAVERDAISEVPTESYLAFLAYCRGLDYQNRGMYPHAQQEFDKALELDDGFEQAQDKRESVGQGVTGATTPEQSLDQLEQAVQDDTGPSETTAGGDLGAAITGLIDNMGTVPGGSDQGGIDVLPVVDETVTIRIRGTIDAQ